MRNNNGASIRRLSGRSLKNNRMRNIFAVSAIALTGILFTAVFSLTGGAMQAMQESTMREVGRMPAAADEIIADTFVLEELGLPCEMGVKIPLRFSFMGEEHPEDAGRGLMDGNLFFDNTYDLEGKIRTVISHAGYEPDAELAYGVNWAYMSSRMDGADPLTVLVLLGVIIVIMLTGYLFIYNIFQISVVNDIRFYGLLKTIGTTKRQIRRLVRRQAFLLSAIGIPVGLIGGFGIGKLLLPIML